VVSAHALVSQAGAAASTVSGGAAARARSQKHPRGNSGVGRSTAAAVGTPVGIAEVERGERLKA
jgi:hypothetical protein